MSNSCCHWDQLYQVWTFETKTEDFLSLNIEILVVETKIYRNWKILFISRPRLSKMMRPRLYPESCWSLCAVMLLITRGTNISHTQRGDKHPHLLQLFSSLLDSDFSPPLPPSLLWANIPTVQIATVLGWWSVGIPTQWFRAGVKLTSGSTQPVKLTPGSIRPAVHTIQEGRSKG